MTMTAKAVRCILLSAVVCCVQSVLLNIHLPLRNADFLGMRLFNQALASNLALLDYAYSNEQIDLFSNYTAHLSLYMADFNVEHRDGAIRDENMRVVLDAVQSAVQEVTPCLVEWDTTDAPVVRDGYALYNVPVTACLQYLSDLVVNATMEFIRRPANVPEWVNALPQPERLGRLEMIDKYGSPHVYKGFQPHIIVGYDTVTPQEERLQVLQKVVPLAETIVGNLTAVAVAMAGVGGMPLQEQQLLEIPLQFPEETGMGIDGFVEQVVDSCCSPACRGGTIAALVSMILVVSLLAWRQLSKRHDHVRKSEYRMTGEVEISDPSHEGYVSYQNGTAFSNGNHAVTVM